MYEDKSPIKIFPTYSDIFKDGIKEIFAKLSTEGLAEKYIVFTISLSASLYASHIKGMHVQEGIMIEFKDAILYMIKKFESLRAINDSGDYYECMWQLTIIEKELKELPDNPDTKVLRQLYEYWNELFMKIENGSNV